MNITSPDTSAYEAASNAAIVSVGEAMSSIIAIIAIPVLFALLFLLSWVINNYVLKKPKKNIWKVAITIWLIIFIINLFSALLNIPLIIGINPTPAFDGGINGTYVSLGYAIEVEGHNLLGDSKYNVYFTNIFK